MPYRLPSPALNQYNVYTSYRSFSWEGLVLKAWGAKFNEPDIVYEFSNGKQFFSNDDTGPYSGTFG